VSQPTPDQVREALRQVQDPDLHQDIVSLGFVTRCEVEGGVADVVINLTTPACPVKDQLKSQAEAVIRAVPGITEVKVEMTAVVKNESAQSRNFGKNIQHIIAVSSGKGGVGKSTATVNLACALAKTGARVGVLDCDVYGPDVPMMMGLSGQPEHLGNKLVPKERHGVKTMSIGYLLEDDKPVMWRGPMIHKLIEQFLADVEWGELDYLLVDMPPGTGDAQISLAQIVPLSGAVLVTTPQAVSTYDVAKAISMFKQVNVEVLGIIENMSGFAIEGTVEGATGGKVTLDLGTRSEELAIDEKGHFATVVNIFGAGGADRLSQKYGFPNLGSIPLNPAVRVGGDGGDPIVTASPDSLLAKGFEDVAGRLAQRLAIKQFALPILQ
jgi:ATP-binding protein involved in chromosome partitioning